MSDEEFVPYHERRLPWERTRGDVQADRGPRGPRRRGPGSCLLSGCGCLLLVIIVLVAGWYALMAQAPRLGETLLVGMVRGAINGNMKVNDRPVEVPPAWREPWLATTRAYATAYREGQVGSDHFNRTLWETARTIFRQGGTIPEGGIRDLCVRMRGALPAQTVAGLPALPGGEGPIAVPPPDPPPASADAGPANDAPADRQTEPAPRNFLDAFSTEQQVRQLGARDRLTSALSRTIGPSGARRILRPGSVVFDFTRDVEPYPGLMDDWTLLQPEAGPVEVVMQDNRGYSAPPCLALTGAEGARDRSVGVAFTTRAGAFTFWYRFEGRAKAGSIFTVSVDDRTAFTDAWPETHPGSYDRGEWRQVQLEGLGAAPKRIEIRSNVTELTEAATVLVDDFVFTP